MIKIKRNRPKKKRRPKVDAQGGKTGESGKEAPQGSKLPPGHKVMTPEDEAMVKSLLESPVGKTLVRTLEPLARRDLNPKNLMVSFNPTLVAIDISVGLTDVNTPLWANLQTYLWNNRMAWRWDLNGPQLMLVVRWFLPYMFNTKITTDKMEIKPADTPTAEEEVGQTKESTLEGPVKRMVEEALEETQKEMAQETEPDPPIGVP